MKGRGSEWNRRRKREWEKTEVKREIEREGEGKEWNRRRQRKREGRSGKEGDGERETEREKAHNLKKSSTSHVSWSHNDVCIVYSLIADCESRKT